MTDDEPARSWEIWANRHCPPRLIEPLEPFNPGLLESFALSTTLLEMIQI